MVPAQGVRAQAQFAQGLAHRGEDLRVGQHRARSHDVDVELEKLAETPGAGFVHPEDRPHLIALEGPAQLGVGSHETRQRDGEIEAKTQLGVFLLMPPPEDPLAGLAGLRPCQHRGAFDDRGLQGGEAVALEDPPQTVDHRLTAADGRAQEVAHALGQDGIDASGHARDRTAGGRMEEWYWRVDSNHRPPDPQSGALTN